ncbi:MurR/RpiR family transcriptional regulator [Caulobacter sp. LARHSG274]
MTAPPETAEALRAQILEVYDGLSKRMKQVARYVLDQPDDLAFETLSLVSQRSGVQPSAVVRFAKSLGFSGANQMQRLIREDLLSRRVDLAYGERVRQFARARSAADDDAGILAEHADADTLALANLKEAISEETLNRAVDRLEQADTIYVAGARRSFPVASYLAYSFQQIGKKTVFIDGVGGFHAQAARTLTPDDLLLAVSYHAYAEETIACARIAAERGAPILAITDSAVSPLATLASEVLLVREAEVRNFRSLAVSLCLAQSLVIAYAFRVTARPPEEGKGG